MPLTQTKHYGFTLVEVLIISPIIVLLIGMFIAFLVTLTRDSLQLREKNVATYSVQDALDTIKTDAQYAIEFKDTTNTLPSPQGRDHGTVAFTTVDPANTLIVKVAATDKNPYDSTRAIVYEGAAPCNSSNPIFTYMSIYFVRNSILYKRTAVPTSGFCVAPWQRNSCETTRVNAGSCVTADEELAKNVSNMTVQYFENSNSTSPITNPANYDKADTVSVQITVTQTIAGKQQTQSNSTRITSVNALSEE